MNKGIIFLGGAATGSLITYFAVNKILKKKYRKIADDSINSMKEDYRKKTEDLAKQNLNKPDISKIVEEKIPEEEIKKDTEKTPYEEAIEKYEVITNIFDQNVYEITEEEYNERNGFEKEMLTYYRDLILANDYDEVIPVETSIGKEAADRVLVVHDTVYIRNESIGTDYLVDYSDKTYSEMSGKYVKEPIE